LKCAYLNSSVLLFLHIYGYAKQQTERIPTSSGRSWGSVGHVSIVEGVHESGVHSQDRDRQVTRAGHARPLRRLYMHGRLI